MHGDPAVAYCDPVDGTDHITHTQSSPGCGSIFSEARNHQRLLSVDPRLQPLHQLHADAQPAADYRAKVQQIIHDKAGEVGWGGQVDTKASATHTVVGGVNEGTDAQQLARCIDQCSTRITRVNAGICLDLVLIVRELQAVTTHAGDNALTH